jgi:CBS domain-containing protein
MTVTATASLILSRKGSQVWTISPEATVFEAISMMADRNIGALLVVLGGRLIGVVSERDYTRKVALKGKSSRETRVREILSSPVISATPNHTIEDCMRLMTEHRVRHLPVLDGETVVGILSIGDLVNWTISAQNAAIEQLEQYISGR